MQHGHFYCRLQVSFYVSSQDMLHLEAEVKNLHAAVEQIQVTLASPELHRLSLREQLTQRQVTIHFIVPWAWRDVCIPIFFFITQTASAGGNGRVQAEGGGGAAVPERPLAARGSSEQPADLPHSAMSAARGQPAAAHHHPTVQHPAGAGPSSLEYGSFYESSVPWDWLTANHSDLFVTG